jgi:hypothetical protein
LIQHLLVEKAALKVVQNPFGTKKLQVRNVNFPVKDSWLEKCSESSNFVHKFAGPNVYFPVKGTKHLLFRKLA